MPRFYIPLEQRQFVLSLNEYCVNSESLTKTLKAVALNLSSEFNVDVKVLTAHNSSIYMARIKALRDGLYEAGAPEDLLDGVQLLLERVEYVRHLITTFDPRLVVTWDITRKLE